MDRKNGNAKNPKEAQQNYEDLKFTTTSRGKSGQKRKSPGQKQANGHTTDGAHRFYDTDASIDTSTVGSVTGRQSGQPVAAHRGAVKRELSPQHGNDRSSQSEGSFETDDDDGALPDGHTDNPPLGEINSRQHKMLQGLGPVLEQARHQPDLGYMGGDSYPSTTSGRVSEARTERYEDSNAKQPQQPRDQTVPNSTNQSQPFVSASLLARQPGRDLTIEQQANGGFTFGKQASRPLNLHRAGPVHSSTGNIPIESKTNVSSNRVQPASVPVISQSSPPIGPTHNQTDRQAEQLAPSRGLDRGRCSKSRGDSHTATSAEPPAVDHPQHSPYRANGHGEVDYQSAGAHSPEHEPAPQSSDLDYDIEDLRQMDFQTLKDQSFDFDPNAKQPVLPTVHQQDPLEHKLSTVESLEPTSQFDFFASMSLNDWEQAGDWFLGRFGDVLAKMKDVRQGKRKAAQSFEDEIESRYLAVGKKRKLIEVSMNEMKENGGKVLAGTPKKVRTK